MSARTLGVPILEAPVHEAVLRLGSDLLPRDAVGGKTIIAQELVLPYGRPDVVAAAVDATVWKSWRRDDVQPCTAPLPIATALALASAGGRATIEDLLPASAGRAERGRIRGALASLRKRRWVEREDDLFVLRLMPCEALRGVSAVEAKLNNLRRAVRQAQSWEGYVDAVWLAFPSAYLAKVPRTQALRRFGLISVEGNRARIVRQPTGPRARGVRLALTEQYLYDRWLANASQTTVSQPIRKPAVAVVGLPH